MTLPLAAAPGLTRVPPPWHLPGIADDLGTALALAEQALRLEQAPHRLDEWDERTLQRSLGARLRGDHEVAAEAHYPSSEGLPRTHRQRCDLVLTPRGWPLAGGATLPFDFCPPEEALWLELKVARAHGEGGRPSPTYGTTFRRQLIADLRKLTNEPRICSAGLVLIVFTETAAELERDLDRFEALLAEHELLAGFRHVRSVPILDRIGHTVGSVALWPTVQRGADVPF